MARVIRLDERLGSARPDRSGNAERGGACEIVIFPGVRYERWAEPEAKPAGKRVKARKKQLERIN